MVLKSPPPLLLDILRAVKTSVYANIYQMLFNAIRRKREQRQVMNNFETIDYILQHRCSISRYGDGELELVMARKYKSSFASGFQKYDAALAQRLEEILDYRHKVHDHLVCLPACAFSYGTSYFRPAARLFWNRYTVDNIDRLLEMTAPGELYGETNISRFYLSHRDKSRCKEFLTKMKRLWEGRNVVIVEGNLTHLGYGNDLFYNVKSLHRILCPAKSAFSKYDEILATVLEHTDGNMLIIMALGMTATVLAYDLAAQGRQALDIGHLDIEYEWMRMGATEKVPVPGKFTNETPNGRISCEGYPEDFKRQILADVSMEE